MSGLELGAAFVEIRPRVNEFRAKLLEGINPGLMAAGALVGVAVAGALFEVGESFEKATDKIRVTTGFTGDKLEELSGVFKQVFTDVPTTMGAASDAVAKLAQRLGLSGEPLRALSDQMLELSRITKTDLGANVDAVSQVFNNWGISTQDQGKKLDELFRASQATGVSVGDLASTMASAGSVTRTVGLTFEQSASLIALLSKAGVSATSVMMPLSRAIATAAKEGKDASSVFSDVWNAIMQAPDATSAAGAAIDVFGARAGPRLAGLIREGQLSYDDLVATVAGGTDTIMKAGEDTQHAGEKMKLAWNRVLVALAPAGEAVAELATHLASGLVPAVDFTTRALGSLYDRAAPVFKTLQDGFAGLKAAFSGEGVTSDGFVGQMERIGVTLRQVWDIAAQFFSTLRTGFTDDEGTGVEKFALRVRSIVLPVIDALRNGFEAVVSFLGANVQPILIGVAAAFAYLAGAAAIGALVAAVSSVIGVLGVLVGAISLPVVIIVALVAGVIYAYTHFKTFRDVLARTGEVLVAIGKSAIQVAQWINSNVIPVLVQVFSYLATQVSHFASAISERWGAIAEAAGHVYAVIRVALMAVAAVVGAVVVAVLYVWNHFHDQILSIVEIVWNEIRNVIDNAIRIVQDVIDIVLSLINGDWGDAWRSLLDILSAVWDLITTLLGNALALLWQLLQVALLALGDLFVAAFDAIVAVVSAALGAIVSWFAGLGSMILGAIGDFASLLVSSGSAVVSGLWNGIQSMWAWFVGMIGAIPGWITSGIGDVTNLLHDAAVNLVVGLWQGISSMGGWLMDKVGSFFGGIKDKVLGVFGIGSPSKVFHGYGVNLVEGLVNGIESQRKMLRDQVNKIGIDSKFATSSTTKVAFGAAGAGGGPVLHIGQLTIDLRGIAPEKAGQAGADAAQGFTQELAKRGLRVEVRAIG